MPSDNPPPARLDRCLADEPPPCVVLRGPTIRERLLRWLVVALTAATWLYLAAVLAVWASLHFGGDCWWPATVILFGPRWLCAVPWPALVLAAVLTRRRLLWPLAVAALVLLGPIASLCIPVARLVGPDGSALRVLTCNIDGHAADAQRMMELIADAKPDVLAFQECPSDVVFDWPEGWNVRRTGGLLIASPFPLGEAEVSRRRHPASKWPPINGLRCAVDTPLGPINVCCVHFRTPREGLSETLDRSTVVSPTRSKALIAGTANRRLESEEAVAWLGNPKTGTGPEPTHAPTEKSASNQGPVPVLKVPTIILGDFNMPTDSSIYRAYWSRYTNAFSTTGWGFGYTKWTPLGKRSYGLRIDHILTSSGISPQRSWLGRDVGSDHLPLLADVVPTTDEAEVK